MIAALFIVSLVQTAPYAAPAPPEEPFKEVCVCPKTSTDDIVTIRGFAVDAELRLAPSGLETLPRQATVFRVLAADGIEAATPFKVWHLSGDQRCGVSFDYGKGYTVGLRRVGDEYETDECLMARANSPKQ